MRNDLTNMLVNGVVGMIFQNSPQFKSKMKSGMITFSCVMGITALFLLSVIEIFIALCIGTRTAGNVVTAMLIVNFLIQIGLGRIIIGKRFIPKRKVEVIDQHGNPLN